MKQIYKNTTNSSKAFTIVELLVVIVVIGILVSITAVAYNGISGKAKDVSIASDINGNTNMIKAYHAENWKYPASFDSNGCPKNENGAVSTKYCLKISQGNAPVYYSASPYSSFSLDIGNGNLLRRITDYSNQLKVDTVGSYVKTWGGTGVEDPYGIYQTQDGGFVATGSTTSFGADGVDMYIAKYNALGNLVWNKTWGGTGTDIGRDIVENSDGQYVVTGHTTSFGAGSADAFLVKFDISGNLVWNKTWGGINGDYSRSIANTSDDGCVVTGYTNNYSAGASDVFLSKYDSNGNLSWVKTWGGTDIEYGRDVYQTVDHGYLVSGLTKSFGGGGEDALLLRFDSDGNFVWNKTWGGGGNDVGYGLTWSDDGGYAITGYTGSYSAGNGDIYLSKFDKDNNLSWTKTWGGISAEEGRGIIKSSDGGYVVTGYTDTFSNGGHDLVVLKYDSNGSLQWNNTWGSSSDDSVSASHNVIQTGDGGFVAYGNTTSYGAGTNDAFIIKFKSDGLISNCASPTCQSRTATQSTPVATIRVPVGAVVSSATPTVDTPSATVTSPSAVISNIINP